MIISTFVTLMLVPTGYIIIEDPKSLLTGQPHADLVDVRLEPEHLGLTADQSNLDGSVVSGQHWP